MSLIRPLALVSLPLAALACRSATLPAEAERTPAAPLAAPAVALPPVEPGASPAPKREPGSAFAVVATSKGVVPYRPVNGPVLLVDSDHRAIYETSADGGVRPLSELGGYFIERYPSYLYLTASGGIWPTVGFELAANARSSSYSQTFLFDVAARSVRPLPESEVRLSLAPWEKGSALGTRRKVDVVHDSSRVELYVVGGSRGATPPKVPRGTSLEGGLVAYPTGEAFAMGEPPDAEPYGRAEGHVLVAEPGGAFAFHDLPAPLEELVRGRTATETIARGERMLQRWDGKAFREVPLPTDAAADAPTRALAIGDDGSAWLVLGKTLYRAAFPGLTWTREPLPAGAEAAAVAATSANDVWLVAEDSAVLHRGGATQAGEPLALPEDEESALRFVAAEPRAFTGACEYPIVLLGDPARTSDAQARALGLGKTYMGQLVRGRAPSGSLVAFEVANGTLDKPALAKLRRALPKLRTKVPAAALACGRLSDPHPLE